MLNTEKIYLHKILRNTVCWTLWEDLFTQNTEEYRMLNTVRRFIYSKYWGILYIEHCGKIYLHKILRNILYVEHCGKIYLHKILYVEHWEDLFTQNTEEYFMLNTVRRFIYTKYWGIVNAVHCGKIYLHKLLRNTLCWTLWEDLFTHNTEEYCMLNTGKIYLHKILRNILYVEHCGKVYLHKILSNTVHWTLWEDLSTQNTEEYCMLNTEKIYLHKILRNTSCWTLGRFIYSKYWGILCVEHCGKTYLPKILRNTVCWTLWEDLFTQNTEEYFMLNTVGRCIYTKYWGIYCMLNTVGRFIYTKYCTWNNEKIYLHKILRNTLCWTLWEDLFTQNIGE